MNGYIDQLDSIVHFEGKKTLTHLVTIVAQTIYYYSLNEARPINNSSSVHEARL